MWKSILAGTVALALSSAGVAFAQQRPGIGPAQPSPPAPQVSPAPQSAPQQAAPAQQRPSVQPQDDARAVAEGRIAELRSRLSLTPEQEKNWPAFEQAYRDFAQLRAERWRDLAAARRSDNPVENFQSWADFASRRVNAMKRLRRRHGALLSESRPEPAAPFPRPDLCLAPPARSAEQPARRPRA